MEIDEEIEHLKNRLNSMEQTHPDYLEPALKELQNLVLATHARLEGALETRILSKILREIKQNTTLNDSLKIWTEMLKSGTFLELSSRISFWDKLRIVRDFKDGLPDASLQKINTYRIEFAHPKGVNLRAKYSAQSATGKVAIRNLLRALVKGSEEMEEYFKKLKIIR